MSTIVAIHEAAHGVIALARNIPITVVTITPTGDSAGHALPAVTLGSIEVVDWLVYLAAGGAAERRMTGKAATLDAHDRWVASLYGAAKTNADPDSAAVAAYLDRFAALADADVIANWKWIERTATALDRRRTLDGGAIADLM